MIMGKSQSERSGVRPLGGWEEVRAELWMQERAVSSLETGKEGEMGVEVDGVSGERPRELFPMRRQSYLLR